MLADVKRELLNRNELKARYGLAMSTVYKWISQGRFPKPLKLGPSRVAWRVADIEAWLSSREQRAN